MKEIAQENREFYLETGRPNPHLSRESEALLAEIQKINIEIDGITSIVHRFHGVNIIP